MNRNAIFALVVAIMLIAVGIVWSKALNTSNDVAPDITAQTDSYISYSDSVISDNPGKTKLLFFHADWCPSCIRLERNLLSSSIPEDVIIIKVNYDDNTAMRERYNVGLQTTIVQVSDQGEELKKWVASPSDHIADLLAKTE